MMTATIVEHLADVNCDIKWDIIDPQKIEPNHKKSKKGCYSKFTNAKKTQILVGDEEIHPTVISLTQRLKFP